MPRSALAYCLKMQRVKLIIWHMRTDPGYRDRPSGLEHVLFWRLSVPAMAATLYSESMSSFKVLCPAQGTLES